MRETIRFIAADQDFALYIAKNLRKSDRRELEAASDLTAEQQIVKSMEKSWLPQIVLVGDIPACIFGVVPASLLSAAAIPWMVGTDVLDRKPVECLRHAKLVVNGWKSSFTHLFNFVSAEHETSIRWLEVLGFTVLPAIRYGQKQHWFRPFEWRA